MCAAVAGPLRPEYLTFQLSFFLAVSNVRVAVPLPFVVTGGLYWPPSSVAVNFSVSAKAGETRKIETVTASAETIGEMDCMRILETSVG